MHEIVSKSRSLKILSYCLLSFFLDWNDLLGRYYSLPTTCSPVLYRTTTITHFHVIHIPETLAPIRPVGFNSENTIATFVICGWETKKSPTIVRTVAFAG